MKLWILDGNSSPETLGTVSTMQNVVPRPPTRQRCVCSNAREDLRGRWRIGQAARPTLRVTAMPETAERSDVCRVSRPESRQSVEQSAITRSSHSTVHCLGDGLVATARGCGYAGQHLSGAATERPQAAQCPSGSCTLAPGRSPGPVKMRPVRPALPVDAHHDRTRSFRFLGPSGPCSG